MNGIGHVDTSALYFGLFGQKPRHSEWLAGTTGFLLPVHSNRQYLQQKLIYRMWLFY